MYAYVFISVSYVLASKFVSRICLYIYICMCICVNVPVSCLLMHIHVCSAYVCMVSELLYSTKVSH